MRILYSKKRGDRGIGGYSNMSGREKVGEGGIKEKYIALSRLKKRRWVGKFLVRETERNDPRKEQTGCANGMHGPGVEA